MFPCFYLYLFIFLFASIWTQYIHFSISLCLICYFPIWNQSVVPCPVLTVSSLPVYRFLRRQVTWSGIPISKNCPQSIVIHTDKVFDIVNKAEIDVFLELSCFFDNPLDVGNLISGSSAFSKTRLTIWKFMVHILLKPGLENFEHHFTSVWDEYNCAVVWAFFGIGPGGPQLLAFMKTSSAEFSILQGQEPQLLCTAITHIVLKVFSQMMSSVLQSIFCFCVCLIFKPYLNERIPSILLSACLSLSHSFLMCWPHYIGVVKGINLMPTLVSFYIYWLRSSSQMW